MYSFTSPRNTFAEDTANGLKHWLAETSRKHHNRVTKGN